MYILSLKKNKIILKKNCYLFLLVLFFACKKDNEDIGYKSGLVKMIASNRTNLYRNDNFIFTYDTEGRVQSINDTVYTYGADGKIGRSQFTKDKNTNGYVYKEDIQKSYTWDVQGRISEIRVDKWLQRSTSPDGGVMENNPSPYIEAHFYYTSNNKLPDSIGYGSSLEAQLETYRIFYHADGNITKEEDISAISYYGVDNPFLRYVSSRTEYTYTDNVKSHLYPLYSKMGFLPRGLGYVASKNGPITSITQRVYFVHQNPAYPAWSKSISNYSYQFASNGYPSTISWGDDVIPTVLSIYY